MAKKLSVVMMLTLLALPAMAQKEPTRAQVEEAGKKPYLRYTVPAKFELVRNSIFAQPSFSTSEGKARVKALPRGTAKEIGQSGAEVWDQFGKDFAVKSILVDSSIVLYETRQDGVKIPVYLADCGDDGKYFNMLKLVSEPEIRQPVVMAQVVPVNFNPQISVPPAQVTEGATIVNNPPFPSSVNLNVTGMPQIPVSSGMPANITVTYHVIQEQKRDRAAKYADYGKGTRDALLGAAAVIGSVKIPNAMERVAKTNATSRENVAITNGNALVNAAKASGQSLVDAAAKGYGNSNFQVTNTNSPNQTSASNPTLNNTSTVAPVQTQTATPTATVSDSGNSTVENRPTNNLTGGANNASSSSTAPPAQIITMPTPAPTVINVAGATAIAGANATGGGLAPGAVVVSPTLNGGVATATGTGNGGQATNGSAPTPPKPPQGGHGGGH